MKPDVLEVEPGVYSILLEGRSYVARVSSGQVEIGGRRFAAEVRRKSGATPRGGRQSVIAAMPGKIVRVLVKEGQVIEPGEGLIVVEAMKMQNEMRAVKAGKVTGIHVRDGVTVAAGEVLLVIE